MLEKTIKHARKQKKKKGNNMLGKAIKHIIKQEKDM